MTTILFPVDFSESSLMSVKYALMLTKVEPYLFHFFHIYPDQLMIPDSSFMDGMDSNAFLNTEIVLELKQQSEQSMEGFLAQVREMITTSQKEGIELTSTVTGGDPEWEIKEIISRIGPDMIVMGTRGEGKKAFLEGSMAEKIMNSVKIPVIAVPDSFRSLKIENIMYATNFSESDYHHLTKLHEVFGSSGIVFHVVHFELKGKPVEDIRMMEVLQHSLKRELPEAEIHFHLMDSDKKNESILSFAKENSIDMVAFIAHRTNIFQNLFSSQIHKKDFFKLELPMLALHED